MLKIKGKRITLRDHQAKDLPDYHKWRSDPEIMQHTLLPRSFCLDDSLLFLANEIKENRKQERKFYFLALVLNENQSYIGDAGFIIHQLNQAGGIVEIGYFVYKAYWGQGLASEAAALMVDYVFTHFQVHKIIANCDAANKGSWRVMEKIGMKKEGHFIKDRYQNGIWADNLRFYLLREEWQSQPGSQ